jgi:parallel beta-helix repeat protein
MPRPNLKQLLPVLILAVFFAWHVQAEAAGPELGWGPAVKTGLDLYVAPNGSDAGEGTPTAPFQTITRARDYVRGLIASGKLPSGGVTVWVRAGRYQLPSSLGFTAADSGTPEKPVIYRACPSEAVVVAMGRFIEPSKWKPINAGARARLSPRCDAGKIVELDVAALGIQKTDELPISFTSTWDMIDLIVDNQRQPLSQWPNSTENIRGVNDPGWVTCNGSKDEQSFYYGDKGKPTDGDHTNELDLDGTMRSARWKKSIEAGHNLWLKGFWRTPWSPVTVKVAEINTTEGFIKLAANTYQGMGSKYTPFAPGSTTYRVGDGREKWCALNFLDEIDTPGEWALDFKDKKIYYWPSRDLNTVQTYIADDTNPVISLNGASCLRFIALTVEGSLGDGFSLANSSNILVGGCVVRNVGGKGITMKGGSNNTFQGNNLYETGNAGISVTNTGNIAQLAPSNTRFINNHIHHTGRLASGYGVIINDSVGITFANNLIHDIPAGGVSCNTIINSNFDYNEIHNVALKESDMGGFYIYGGWICYGNEFRWNFIHHINRSNGLYADDGTSGPNFVNNIVLNSLSPIVIGGGHHVIARNSLFIDCKNGPGIDDRGVARKYLVSNHYGDKVRGINPSGEPWKSFGEKLAAKYGYPSTDPLWSCVLDPEWHPEFPNGSKLIDNVEVVPKGPRKPSRGTVTVANNVSIPTVARAGFFDFANMDLRTKNAEILSKFPDLNAVFPTIGLQKDEYRIRVPSRSETGGLSNRGASGDPWYEDPDNIKRK